VRPSAHESAEAVLPASESTPSAAAAFGPSRSAAPESLLHHAGLLEAQQLGNVGLLAAGLAHDVNNLLTVILGCAELTRNQTPVTPDAKVHLQTIENTVRRAGALCRAMLACARTDQTSPVAIDVNGIVREVIALLQTSRLAHHRIQLDLAEHLPEITVQPAQFRQLLLNLVLNAVEACGERGGHIRIATARARLDERAVRALQPTGSCRPGACLRLRVADDGGGMDAPTLAQIFQPFFSRKGAGRGLGLASVWEILRGHGGGVRVFSEAGRGSIFDVFLPLDATHAGGAGPEATTPPIETAEANAPAPGHVLIADDEEVLRESLVAFLRSQGLTVQGVGAGDDALAYLHEHPETHLALLDRIMPRKGGFEVLENLRAEGNTTPVVLMSGNPEHEPPEKLAQFGEVASIAKPFSLGELMSLISRYVPGDR
jgi:CheY-like chemotaxis protein